MSAWENFRLEWSPDPLSVTTPTWQDITAYADAAGHGPISITTGTPNTGAAAGTARPATMTVTLNNTDHRFTFGYTGSPLSPNWKPGRRIRCYEIVGGRRFDWFTGYLQPPETDDWAESGDQFVTVAAVDRLGRLATDRPFVSTLAEYILYNGAPAGYWPLLDPPGSPNLRPNRPATQLPLTVSYKQIGTVANPTGAATATLQGGTAPPGDDVSTLRLVPAITSNVVGTEANLAGPITPIAVTASTFTLAWWMYFEDVHTSDLSFGAASADGSTYVRLVRTGGGWFLTEGFTLTATVCLGPQPGRWNLIALRLFTNNIGTGTIEYWRNGDPAQTVNLFTTPPGFTIAALNFEAMQGNLAHLQIYTGGTAYTRAMHIAQLAEGFNGLAGQGTGQRIRTLAGYAGIGASELSLVDPGTSGMARATLAGQSPLAEMAVAETTEQGRLRANGAGLLVFDPRTRRYQS